MPRQSTDPTFPFVFALALLFLLVPSDAHAYIDPGLGSLAFQGLLAAFAALSAAAAWMRLKALGLFKKRDKDERTERGHQ